jgi:hypothetical protein
MDRFYLGIICASAALLVAAIIAAAPSMKSDADGSNPVLRLVQPPPKQPATLDRCSASKTCQPDHHHIVLWIDIVNSGFCTDLSSHNANLRLFVSWLEFLL